MKTTQTPEELEAQSLEALRAKRKDRNTPIQLLHGTQWYDATGDLAWNPNYHYRIKPNHQTSISLDVWWKPSSLNFIHVCERTDKAKMTDCGFVLVKLTIQRMDGE